MLHELGCVTTSGRQHSLIDELRLRGYALVDLATLRGDDTAALLPLAAAWQETFLHAFALSDDVKSGSGAFRFEKGVSVGYKTENAREFFETRLVDGGRAVEPDYSNDVQGYGATVRALYVLLRRAARVVLTACTASLGLDPRCILDLTDLDDAVVPGSDRGPSEGQPGGAMTHINEEPLGQDAADLARVSSPLHPPPQPPPPTALSPSLLRVCKYSDAPAEVQQHTHPSPWDSPPLTPLRQHARHQPTPSWHSHLLSPRPPIHHTLTHITHQDLSHTRLLPLGLSLTHQRAADDEAFGAHTDTSFLTIGLRAARPGLQVRPYLTHLGPYLAPHGTPT